MAQYYSCARGEEPSPAALYFLLWMKEKWRYSDEGKWTELVGNRLTQRRSKRNNEINLGISGRIQITKIEVNKIACAFLLCVFKLFMFESKLLHWKM
jgi:hypothetical protein